MTNVFSEVILSLFVLWGVLTYRVGTGRMRPLGRRGRRWQIVVVVLLSGLLALAYGYEGRAVDFDTWSVPSRMRLDDLSRFSTAARPIQHWWTYWIMIPLLHWRDDPMGWRLMLTVVGMMAIAATILLCRRALFGSPHLGPAVAASGFLLLMPSGEFLADTWNDHIPLIPLHILGVAALMRLPVRPAQGAWVVVWIFFVHSLNHSIEPYLWTGALGLAVLMGRGSLRWRAGVLLLVMPVITVLLISFTPGGWREAANFRDMHVTRHGLEKLTYFEVLGIAYRSGAPELGQLLPGFESGLGWLGLALLAAVRGGRAWRERILAILMLGAVVVPAIYEPDNPERHLTIGITAALVLGRVLVRLAAMQRTGNVRNNPAVLVPALVAMMAGYSAIHSLPSMLGTHADRHSYLQAARLLRAWMPADALVVIPSGDVWHHVARQAVPDRRRLLTSLGDVAKSEYGQARVDQRPPLVLTGQGILGLVPYDYDSLRIRSLAPGFECKVALWSEPDRLPTQLGVAEVADLRLTAARWYEDRLSVELTEGTGAGAWPVRVEVFESFNGGLSPAEPRVPLVVAEGVWPGTENPTVPTTMIMSGLERPQTTGVLLAVVNRPSPETMPDLFAADNWRVVTGKLGVDAVSTMSGALAYPEWVQPPAYHFIGSRHILAGRIRAPEDRGTVATTATVTTAKPDREGSLITGIQVAAFPIPALEKGQTEDLTLSWFSMDLVHYLIVLQVEVSEDDQSRGAQVPAPHVYLPRYD